MMHAFKGLISATVQEVISGDVCLQRINQCHCTGGDKW